MVAADGLPQSAVEFVLFLERTEAAISSAAHQGTGHKKEVHGEHDAAIWRGKLAAYEQTLRSLLAAWDGLDQASTERYRSRIELLGPALERSLQQRQPQQPVPLPLQQPHQRQPHQDTSALPSVATSHSTQHQVAAVGSRMATRAAAPPSHGDESSKVVRPAAPAALVAARQQRAAAAAQPAADAVAADLSGDAGLDPRASQLPASDPRQATPGEVSRASLFGEQCSSSAKPRAGAAAPSSSKRRTMDNHSAQTQRIEAEMVEATDTMKQLANSFSATLQQDNQRLEEASRSQDSSLDKVEAKTKQAKQMLWSGTWDWLLTMAMLIASVIVFFMMIPFIIIT